MDKVQTEWKNIKGYENYYQISNTGEVRSKSRFIPIATGGTRHLPGRTIKFKLSRDGYKMVTLSMQGHSKSHYIHRLVAAAFIPNEGNKPEVNHINGRKKDNKVENLEWMTHAENMCHAYRSGFCTTVGATHPMARTVHNTITGEEYKTIREAAKAIGYSSSTLTNMLRGWNRNTSPMVYKEEVKEGL